MSDCDVMDRPDRAGANGCAVCGAILAPPVVVRLVRSHLRACASCGSWTYFPRADAAEQSALHDNEQYFDHPYFTLRRSLASARRRCREAFSRLASGVDIASLRGERILDIGCDTGVFLKAAQEQFGIVPVGIDVAVRALAVAREQGIEAYQTAADGAPATLTGFPVVTAIDLLEHVPDPVSLLRSVRVRTRPGGLLYLETPNLRSAVYWFGRRLSLLTGGRPEGLLERLFPPHHIHYFRPEAVDRMARQAGLEVVHLGTRILPSADIAASPAALLAIGALQLLDRVLGTRILICAVLRRPMEGA